MGKFKFNSLFGQLSNHGNCQSALTFLGSKHDHKSHNYNQIWNLCYQNHEINKFLKRTNFNSTFILNGHNYCDHNFNGYHLVDFVERILNKFIELKSCYVLNQKMLKNANKD